jgi:hypothetical protein
LVLIDSLRIGIKALTPALSHKRRSNCEREALGLLREREKEAALAQ